MQRDSSERPAGEATSSRRQLVPVALFVVAGVIWLNASDVLLDEPDDFTTGADVIAAFPPPTEDFRGYEIVRRVLSELDETIHSR